ncbi:MAG: hypothetical protein AB1714_10095 [Acidobacteriota bacterium]
MTQIRSCPPGTAAQVTQQQHEPAKAIRGQTLKDVARVRNVALRDLQAANPQIRNPNQKLRAGQTVNLPPTRGVICKATPTASGQSDTIERVRPNLFAQVTRTGADTQPARAWQHGNATPADRQLRESAFNDVMQGVRNSGAQLDAADRARLQGVLEGQSGEQLAKTAQFFKQHVAGSPNALQAARTFLDLKEKQAKLPASVAGRLNDETIQTLTRAVADRRGPALAGAKGIMGQQQALDAADAIAKMSPKDHTALDGLLRSAGTGGARGADPQTERALILKAVAARRDRIDTEKAGRWETLRRWAGRNTNAMNEVSAYAAEIRGKPREELLKKSTTLDLNEDAKDEALQQRWLSSCGATVTQMARAEADPIYALDLHKRAAEGIHPEKITSYEAVHKSQVADEQKKMMREAGVRSLRSRGQESESYWGTNLDTDDKTKLLNSHVAKHTNKTYSYKQVEAGRQGLEAALNRIDGNLRRGGDVPVLLKSGDEGHYVLLSDVRNTRDGVKYLVTDPWDGKTTWVKREDFLRGQIPVTGGSYALRGSFE